MVGVQGSEKNVQNMQILKWFWSLAISKVKKSVFFSRADRDGGKPCQPRRAQFGMHSYFSHTVSTQTREGIKFTQCSGRCQDECISQGETPHYHAIIITISLYPSIKEGFDKQSLKNPYLPFPEC